MLLFDIETQIIVGAPHRVLSGWIDGEPVVTGAAGGNSSMSLRIVTAGRAPTRTLSLKKSDASQRLRDDDRFRRDANVSGAVSVYWGEQRAPVPGGTPAALRTGGAPVMRWGGS